MATRELIQTSDCVCITATADAAGGGGGQIAVDGAEDKHCEWGGWREERVEGDCKGVCGR